MHPLFVTLAWLPREESRNPGLFAQQTEQSPGNDCNTCPKAGGVADLRITGLGSANGKSTYTPGSPVGYRFTVTNNGGVVTRTCDQHGKGGCPDDGNW